MTLPIAEKCHHRLCMQYGDYMTQYQPKNRKAFHVCVVDVSRDYRQSLYSGETE